MSNLTVGSRMEGLAASHAASANSAADSKAVPQGSEGSVAKAQVANFVTSPRGVFDPQSGLYLLQYRDQSTGQVTRQYPSEKVVDAYKKGLSTGETSSQASGETSVATPQAGNAPSGGTADTSSSAPVSSSTGTTAGAKVSV